MTASSMCAKVPPSPHTSKTCPGGGGQETGGKGEGHASVCGHVVDEVRAAFT
jgi:hypothetical protein